MHSVEKILNKRPAKRINELQVLFVGSSRNTTLKEVITNYNHAVPMCLRPSQKKLHSSNTFVGAKWHCLRSSSRRCFLSGPDFGLRLERQRSKIDWQAEIWNMINMGDLNINWLGGFLPSTLGHQVKKQVFTELQTSEVPTLQRDVALWEMAWVLKVLQTGLYYTNGIPNSRDSVATKLQFAPL